MKSLNRFTTVMHRAEVNDTDGFVAYLAEEDALPSNNEALYIKEEDYIDMGEPEHLTIVIQPGSCFDIKVEKDRG